MNCTKCGDKISEKIKDFSLNSLTNKEYERSIFVCTKCDVWITIETPKNT